MPASARLRRMVKRNTLVLVAALLAGCALTNPNVTPGQQAKDKYECEHEAYSSTQGAATFVADGLYRDCLRARGYN